MMTATYRFGEFTLTASTRELKRGDMPIAISPRAFDCLAYLIEHRDRAVGKDELVAAIWERVDVSDTQLGQTVLRARRAVNDDGQTQNVIRTVSRFGYRWVADVAIERRLCKRPVVAASPESSPKCLRQPVARRSIESEPESAAPADQTCARHAPRSTFSSIALAAVGWIVLALRMRAGSALRRPGRAAGAYRRRRAADACRTQPTAMRGCASARWISSPSACVPPASRCRRARRRSRCCTSRATMPR